MVELANLFHLAQRTAIGTLRTMVNRQQLPAPVTPRSQGGKIHYGADAVGKKALWDATAVDRALDPRRHLTVA